MPGPQEGSDERAVLCYPQTGSVGIPVIEDPEKQPLGTVTVAFGIPLHPQVMLAIVPKTIGTAGLSMIHDTAHAYSVGLTNNCRKVVVPPRAIERYGLDDLAQRIRTLRTLAAEMAWAMTQMKDLIMGAYRTAGLI